MGGSYGSCGVFAMCVRVCAWCVSSRVDPSPLPHPFLLLHRYPNPPTSPRASCVLTQTPRSSPSTQHLPQSRKPSHPTFPPPPSRPPRLPPPGTRSSSQRGAWTASWRRGGARTRPKTTATCPPRAATRTCRRGWWRWWWAPGSGSAWWAQEPGWQCSRAGRGGGDRGGRLGGGAGDCVWARRACALAVGEGWEVFMGLFGESEGRGMGVGGAPGKMWWWRAVVAGGGSSHIKWRTH